MQRIVHRAGNAMLTGAALAGLLCLLVVLAGFVFGVKPLVFTSGSMSPTIPAGSLAFTRATDAADIAAGDVVSVRRNGTWVTHRVVSIEEAGTRNDQTVWVAQLKGDDNATVDPSKDQFAEAPRVFWHVPVLGSVVNWLSRPPGIYVLALYLSACVGLIVRGKGDAPATAAAADEIQEVSPAESEPSAEQR